jgi:uncharacterized membrane protein
MVCLVALLFVVKYFADLNPHVDVVFSVIVVTTICLLLVVFGPKIVREAVRIFRGLQRARPDDEE